MIRVLSTRMVEIAQILAQNDIRGGGVYSFSYLVLGPVASFVAVASIMVDYILTACISTVSAVINGTAFLPMGDMRLRGMLPRRSFSIDQLRPGSRVSPAGARAAEPAARE